MDIYIGRREYRGTIVTKNGQILNPRRDLRDMDVELLDWKIDSPAARQLAIALLGDRLKVSYNNGQLVESYISSFLSHFVIHLDILSWVKTGEQIDQAMRKVGIDVDYHRELSANTQ